MRNAEIAAHFDEVPVVLPDVRSDSPIIIRVCPEIQGREGYGRSWNVYSEKGYQEHGKLYFNEEKAMNCTPGGGGA